MALPLVAWSFGGIESTTMAAFEAKSIKDIALASKSIHWILIVLYFFYTLGVMFTVPWDASDLTSFHPWVNVTQATGNNNSQLYQTFNTTDQCNKSTISVVQAICNIHRPQDGIPNADVLGLASFVNAVLLYSVLSCGNAALYMASRTLYGLASSERVKRKGLTNPVIRYLGSTRPGTGVPFYAVVFSWLIFCWVPFLGFSRGGDWPALAGVSCQEALKVSHQRRLLAPANIFHTSDEAIPLCYVEHGLYRGLGKHMPSIRQISKLVRLNS